MQQRQQQNPIETLRRRVDFSPFVFPADAPKWLSALGRYTKNDLGVLAILGSDQTINARDPLSLGLAAFTSSLYRQGAGRHISLGLTLGAHHIPLLFAATCILSDALLNGDAKGPNGVLIISKDLDTRSRYCELKIKDEPLDTAYPGSRMRPNGEVVPINSKVSSTWKNGKGVCFFSPGQELPSTRLRPRLAIIDLRYGILSKRAKDIADWAGKLDKHTSVLAIYTLGDRDTSEALHQLKFENVPIDHEAVADCAVSKSDTFATSVDWNLLKKPNYLEREHQIICVDGDEIEKALIEAQQMIQQQSQECMALNRARWILATLSRLPVPPIWYEQSARSMGRFTLARVIEKLSLRHDAGMGLALQSLKMQFENILQKLQTSNPRAEKLAAILPDLAKEAGTLLILVRDEVSKRALQSWLTVEKFPKEVWMSNVEIVACPNYYPMALKSYPIVLVNGALPQRYRWIVGGALGDTVKFLTYSSEIQAIENQLEDIYGEKMLQERFKARERFFSDAPVSAQNTIVTVKRRTPKLKLQKPQTTAQKPAKPSEHKPIAKDFRDLPHALEAAKNIAEQNAQKVLREEKARQNVWDDKSEDEEQITDLAELLGEAPHADDIECYGFGVQANKQGKKTLWLAKDQTVECLKKDDQEGIIQCSPSELIVGDTIIIIAENARVSLFDRVVQIAENQPALQYLASFRREWQEAMKTLQEKYQCRTQGYDLVYSDLKKSGSSISTTLSVRNWVTGRIMGPNDLSSIVAVGRVSKSDAIEKNAAAFDSAFHTIRTIHQTLGRKLIRTIHDSLIEEDEGNNSDAFWLPVSELLDTVDLAEIRSQVPDLRAIPPQLIGRLLPA